MLSGDESRFRGERAHPSTISFRYSASAVRRFRTSAAFPSKSFSRTPVDLLLALRFRSPSRCRPTISASFSTAAAPWQSAVSTSSATTVAVCRKERICEEDMATTQVCRVVIRSEVYSNPSSAAAKIRRSISSESEARKRLNAGSFEVSGYIGEFS
jgi:hypothetical protein